MRCAITDALHRQDQCETVDPSAEENPAAAPADGTGGVCAHVPAVESDLPLFTPFKQEPGVVGPRATAAVRRFIKFIELTYELPPWYTAVMVQGLASEHEYGDKKGG